MRTFDISPLLRASVGFENLNRLVDLAARGDTSDNGYPPYNIEKTGEGSYRVAMAVAGFAQHELELTVQENSLIVTGTAAEDKSERQYLHRGIAKRAFERRFQLADTIKVTNASYADGLLNIDLVREIPEHKKPRKVEIGAAATATIDAPAEPQKIAA